MGEFEQIVLLEILRLGEGAYGLPIREEIRACTDRDPAPRLNRFLLYSAPCWPNVSTSAFIKRAKQSMSTRWKRPEADQ